VSYVNSYVNSSGGILKPMSVEALYADDGHSHDASTDGWGVPVGGRISSRFGMRFHPILRRRKMHTGDDLAARYGAPIKAAHNGRVLWSGWKKAYGNTIIIDNGNGVTTLYGHASKLGVRPGQPIKRGEYIGNVGSTGWSTGPHLHFEVRKNGKPINPTPYLHGQH
jgi:murein DD-endopeptidase MepM/ murein hydrolase activator NlpD